MKQARKIVFGLIWVIFFVLLACGKKGPPFIPEREITLLVEQLNAEWKEGAFYLTGTVVDVQDNAENATDITGCRVYHAWYPLHNPPCEGCPIDYGTFNEIRGEFITREGFSCKIKGTEKRGLHFFKVCLIDRKGESGPYSDEAKLIIEDHFRKSW